MIKRSPSKKPAIAIIETAEDEQTVQEAQQLSYDLTAAKAKLTQLKIELEKERIEKRNLRENLEKSSSRIAELEAELGVYRARMRSASPASDDGFESAETTPPKLFNATPSFKKPLIPRDANASIESGGVDDFQWTDEDDADLNEAMQALRTNTLAVLLEKVRDRVREIRTSDMEMMRRFAADLNVPFSLPQSSARSQSPRTSTRQMTPKRGERGTPRSRAGTSSSLQPLLPVIAESNTAAATSTSTPISNPLSNSEKALSSAPPSATIPASSAAKVPPPLPPVPAAGYMARRSTTDS